MTNKDGILHVKYYCAQCNRRKYYSSCKSLFSKIMTALAFMNGLSIARIARFFTFLNCPFLTVRNMFYHVQSIVRPTISNFYQNCRQTLINQLLQNE